MLPEQAARWVTEAIGHARDDFFLGLAAALAQIHDVDAAVAACLDPYRLYHQREAATLPSWIPNTPVPEADPLPPRAT
jgi:hypothetical protein